MSDVAAKPLEPLMPGFLYRGKVTICAGLPGDAKSLTSNDIAARITSGGRWPVGNGRFDAAHVLMLTAEDDPNDTIRPRLDMAQADNDLIDLIEGVHSVDEKTEEQTLDLVSLINDLAKIEALVIERDTHLLIVDPLTSFADSDTNKTKDMRRLLDGLAQMAIRTRVAVLVITHLNKRADARNAMQMIAGSHVIVAAVRVVFVMGRDPEDNDRFVMLPIKMNIGPSNEGFAFRVVVKKHSVCGDVPTVSWEIDHERGLTANEALIDMSPRSTATSEKAVEVCDWLRGLLRDGPVMAAALWDAAESEGYSTRAVKSALKMIKAVPRKVGMTGKWQWSLAPKSVSGARDE